MHTQNTIRYYNSGISTHVVEIKSSLIREDMEKEGNVECVQVCRKSHGSLGPVPSKALPLSLKHHTSSRSSVSSTYNGLSPVLQVSALLSSSII